MFIMAKKKLPTAILEYFREEGRKGGSKGGKIAASKMTAEQRSERARKGGLAREAKRAAAEVTASEKNPATKKTRKAEKKSKKA